MGTFQRTRSPQAIFRGAGFVVADGRHVLTNAHLLPEVLAVFFKLAGKDHLRSVTTVAIDKPRDLALLKTPVPGGFVQRPGG